MEWLWKKVRYWINIEWYVKQAIEKQAKILLEAVVKGEYAGYGSQVQDVSISLDRLAKKQVKVLSNEEISKRVNEVVNQLAINRETFLDDIVKRLKAKQV